MEIYLNTLKKKKINFSVILINHTEKKLKDISKEFYESKISRVYINGYSNLFKDSFNIIKLFNYYLSFFIKKRSLKFSKSEKKIISQKLTIKSFIDSRTNLRLNENLIKIFNKNNVSNKKIVLTFEGHSFERIIFKYCNDNKFLSFAYFFSVIRKKKTSVFFNFQKKYMPNTVLTTGPVIKKFFNKNFKNKNTFNVINVGSTKSDKIKSHKKKNKALFNTILVCPEGFYSESKLMINFSKKILNELPNTKIIFRSHPVLDKNIINSYIKKYKLQKNFKFSENSLMNDIQQSNFLLYRGSGICIKATLHGLVPINLKLKNEVSLDPLFEVNNNIIFDVNSLKTLLKKYGFYNDKINFNLKKIQDYCLNYYTPLKLNKLISILRNSNR